MKNKEGLTPIELSKKLNDEEMISLFKGIQEICEEKLKPFENQVFIKEIIMKSGDFNGKTISNLDTNIISVKIEMVKESLIMTCYKKLGDHIKVTMELKKMCFHYFRKNRTKN